MKALERGISDDAAEYFATLHRAEQIRVRLVDKVNAKSWLAFYPDAGPRPDTQHVPNDPLLEDQPKRTISHIFADLRRDAEHLPTLSGVRVDTRRAEALYNHRAGFEPTSGDRRRRIR